MKKLAFAAALGVGIIGLAACSTVNGLFVSLQSGKNYIGDLGLVFNGLQKGYETLCTPAGGQAFCSVIAPKMKAASTAAISVNGIAGQAACVADADPTAVGNLAVRVADAIFSIETIVQEAQAKSGRKALDLNSSVTIAGVGFMVAVQTASNIAILNAKGATCDDLNRIQAAIEADDAIIQAY